MIALTSTGVFAAGSLAAPGPLSSSPAGMEPDAAQVLIVGDSIAVGTEPFLGRLITDREVIFDAQGGRTTPQGMRALRFELTRVIPQTVVINLGTNDGARTGVFADRIRRTLAALPTDTCVVWPTISRPPRKGDYHGLNRVLRQAARRDARLTIVDWERMVAMGTVVLPDGVHPDVDGFRHLSRATAAAVRRGCEAAPAW